MIPQSSEEYIVFSTKNGEWKDYFIYNHWINQNSKSNLCFHSSLDLLFITSSTFKVPQLEIEVNDGTNEEIPFCFNITDFQMEDCSICYNHVLSNCVHVLSKCNHRFCGSCVTNYLENAFKEGNLLNTSCLDMNCKQELSDEDLIKAVGTNGFGKIKQYRMLAHLRLEPNCRWCPKDTCDNGVIGNPKDENFPRLTCNLCFTNFCFHCSDYWHPNLSCKDKDKAKLKYENKTFSKRVRKEEKETRKWMKDNKTVKCSKCKALVQRKDGCNHMTCPCGHEFCWLCGETIITVLGDHDFPWHYTTGACAGLQFSRKDRLTTTRKVVRTAIAPVRFGLTLPLRPLNRSKK